jgi:hypothetical protein
MATSDDDTGSSPAGEEVVSVTTETSWLSRLGQSIIAVGFGLLLVVASCILLFWNEGRAVTTARSLTEGAGLVHTVAADKVDPANEGKLVYVTGTLSTTGSATDSDFAVKTDGVRLARHVEMFQWTEQSAQETTKKLGGGETTRTTYTYRQEWVDRPVDSQKFHTHDGRINPPMNWRTRLALAPGIKLGVFAVPDTLMHGFGKEEALAVGADQVTAFQKRISGPVQAIDGVLYVGLNPVLPNLGDYRIRFAEVRSKTASVVARQAGPTFEAYTTRAGGKVELIATGNVPAADMFKQAQSDNRLWTWLIRLGGCVLMLVGFALIMYPLTVLADVVPILGSIVGAGTAVVAFLCTAAIAPVIIAIAWFAYRPLVAVITLVVGGALVVGVGYLARQYKSRKAVSAHA